MYLLKFSEITIYFVVFIMVGRAAALIYSLQFVESKKSVHRLRLMNSVKKRADGILDTLYNENLDRLLHSIGRPLSLDSVKYNLVRCLLLGGWFIYITADWYLFEGRYPYNIASLILALYIFTQPVKGLPLFYILEKLKDLQLREKNKECFTLYSMVQNEFYTDVDRPLNMYATLNKLKPYFKAIDKALGKAILLWKRNPAEALDAFAVEVGTEEAKDLAQILKNVDLSSPQDARDILDSRYEQFVTKRHENHRRYRNNIGLIGYVAALLPVFAVIYNAMVIFNLEKQELLKFIYQR